MIEIFFVKFEMSHIKNGISIYPINELFFLQCGYIFEMIKNMI